MCGRRGENDTDMIHKAPSIVVSLLLLQELQGDETTPEPEPEAKPVPSARRPLRENAPPKPVSVSQSRPQPVTEARESVKMVSQRLDIYKQAINEAEIAGEGGKAKRYKRGRDTLEQVCFFNVPSPSSRLLLLCPLLLTDA